MRLDVLNPQGRDAPVDYRHGVAGPEAGGHAPVNYRAFAAATGGQFHREIDAAAQAPADAVLVLIRQRLRLTRNAVATLKKAGRKVFVSWKETGRFQIAEQTRWWYQRRTFGEILALADGAIAVTEAARTCYRAAGPKILPVHFLPTPYPVDLPAWDFSRPLAERRGIFVGTRQFDVPGRRHAQALAMANELARETGAPVTVFNFDGPRAARAVRERLPDVRELNLIEARRAYPDYLREIARHRVVLQRDESSVPGQVAGDALLCRVVNVGGDGATQQQVFPEFSEPTCGEAALLESCRRLLTDEAFYADAVMRSQARAAEHLSFAWARKALAEKLTPTSR